MSEIAKRIDTIIRIGLAPLLREAGFKKKARTFYREHSDHIDVINVQASRWNNTSEVAFTVNVGVYYPAISQITDALPVCGTPKEYDCTARKRIGSLREDGRDHWWTIDHSSNDSAAARDLASQVEEYCLPWLDRMSNLDVVKYDASQENRSFIAAGIELYRGNRTDAQEHFDRALKEQPRAKSKLLSWAKKHGLKAAVA